MKGGPVGDRDLDVNSDRLGSPLGLNEGRSRWGPRRLAPPAVPRHSPASMKGGPVGDRDLVIARSTADIGPQ